ncbi:MAG TPA: hypothetical protein VFJ98_08905 [Mycobacteriales bacterium]|nr:hypothetical protein [Mycobacteriales bacterium]
MTTDATARRRAAAAARWRPDAVRLLLVDEAPPSAPDRYFYFTDVDAHDSLFRYVVRGVLGVEPSRDKEPLLEELCAAGVFLLDASRTPFRDRREAFPACLPDLVARARALRPEHVLLVGARLYDTAYRTLRDADLPVLDARLPYPGSGQQRRFLDGLGEVLDAMAD